MKTKSSQIDIGFIDKSKIYVEIVSPKWRSSAHISLEDIFSEFEQSYNEKHDIEDIKYKIDNETLIIDPSSLMVKINPKLDLSYFKHCDVNISKNSNYYLMDKNTSTLFDVSAMIDDNYLYIYVKNKWKRIVLTDF